MYLIFAYQGSVCARQVRQRAALRETLSTEREAAGAELEALRAIIHKLENQRQEKLPAGPVISEKEVEERRRAEEKAAQEISRLTQVSVPKQEEAKFPTFCLGGSRF